LKFLVASLRHELLPLAHRLRREGHEVEALVWRPQFERAWGGSIDKVARHSDGSLHKDMLQSCVEAARSGHLTVVTNVRRVEEVFTGARVFGTAQGIGEPQDHLLLGGWFTGEEVRAPHLLVADWGPWTGGGGPRVLGGLTLVRLGEGAAGGSAGGGATPKQFIPTLPGFVAEAAQHACEHLKRAGFRGLFHFDVRESAHSGTLELQGLVAGWPWLHTQAWLAELESLSMVLGGQPPTLRRRFVTVLPVTVPPWPNEKNTKLEAGLPVEGLTPQQQGSCFWYDMRVNAGPPARLETAGLDGLLAVATGASDSTPALARSRALELAGRLRVPGKQVRLDVGLAVDAALATLEDRWGFVA